MKIERYGGDGTPSNCYLVVTDNREFCAVIDPSVSYSSVLRQRGSMPRVKAILLTHAHFDHMLEMNSWRENTAAPLCLMYQDAQNLDDGTKTLFSLFPYEEPVFAPAERRLDDGDEITVGNITLRTVYTPGHTKGSCVYICEDVIFSGDTLFRCSVGRTDFPGGNMTQLMNSLNKLKRLSGDYTVYPGHGESTTLEFERKFNRYIRDN